MQGSRGIGATGFWWLWWLGATPDWVNEHVLSSCCWMMCDSLAHAHHPRPASQNNCLQSIFLSGQGAWQLQSEKPFFLHRFLYCLTPTTSSLQAKRWRPSCVFPGTQETKNDRAWQKHNKKQWHCPRPLSFGSDNNRCCWVFLFRVSVKPRTYPEPTGTTWNPPRITKI